MKKISTFLGRPKGLSVGPKGLHRSSQRLQPSAQAGIFQNALRGAENNWLNKYTAFN